MAFKSDTYRVLIASPSDLTEERDIATEVVNEWNVQHAAAEGIVLLPVTWETHAVPETGVRPREAINRQFVRDCDVLVGMFWTEIGTSTGVAESGTVEEINEFVDAKKPAILYFSSRRADPNTVDINQQKKLKMFKASTCETVLVDSFKTPDELRQKLLHDLTQQVRDLIKCPNILRRSDKAIAEAEHEFYEKVWWNRHYVGDPKELTPEQRKYWDEGDKHAQKITKKYGLKELQVSTFDWGMINGKLSALRWVMGSEWDTLDT